MAYKCPPRTIILNRTYRPWKSTYYSVIESSQPAWFLPPPRRCLKSPSPTFRTRPYATSSQITPVVQNSPGPPRNASVSFEQHLETASSILASSTVPNEQEVYSSLKICESLAIKLDPAGRDHGRLSKSSDGPTTTLLSMRDGPTPEKVPNMALNARRKTKKVSEIAYKIVQDPKIFITRSILELYVRIQVLLGQPQSFPHVFDLYASKDIPKSGSSPPVFSASNSNSASVAVPSTVAESALASAIELKDLALCLSIIDMSVATPAFRRAKFIRKALLPVTAITLSPIAAYNTAWQICKDSDFVEPQTLTTYATVGIMAYVGVTLSIGFVALTTANDQMDRITWIPGTPLFQRWSREEERALVDQVAGAWGLKNVEKRGSEEGWEWEELRKWTFNRSMYLDKPELMEGME